MRQTANAQRANVFPIEKRSVEMADILREHIGEYQQRYPLLPGQYKIVNNLLSCRTAVLGGHVEECDHCGTRRISYNSCRNRHCPKCQHMPRERWLEARKAELLPVSYFHNVFTLPHELNPIILFNKKIMLNILFKAVSQTLLAFGANPKNKLHCHITHLGSASQRSFSSALSDTRRCAAVRRVLAPVQPWVSV